MSSSRRVSLGWDSRLWMGGVGVSSGGRVLSRGTNDTRRSACSCQPIISMRLWTSSGVFFGVIAITSPGEYDTGLGTVKLK